MPRVNPILPNDGEDADAIDVSGPFLALLAIFNGNIGTDNIADGAITAAKIGGDVSALGVPTGVYMPFGGTVAPAGWLLCDGSAYARSTYATLFGVIGTAYGSDSDSTFKVPNMKQSAPVGIDSTATAFATVGKVGGEVNHTLSAGEMPVHSHGVNDPGHSHSVGDPGHSHGTAGNYFLDAGGNGNLGLNTPGNRFASGLSNVQVYGAGTGIFIYGSGANISIQNAGSGGAHNNMPPFVASNFIIKT